VTNVVEVVLLFMRGSHPQEGGGERHATAGVEAGVIFNSRQLPSIPVAAQPNPQHGTASLEA
jgi:hypothetical protein